ncbi:Uncharacterised protein [Bordetella pertussis]|nr:Uncharacterised protein [Bordetella pertussis]
MTCASGSLRPVTVTRPVASSVATPAMLRTGAVLSTVSV